MIYNEDAVLAAALAAAASNRTVIFDLDNTLYRELDFLVQAYRLFAVGIAEAHQRDRSEIEAYLTKGLIEGRRSALVQDFAAAFDLPVEPCLTLLLNCLRERSLAEDLQLFRWADRFFDLAPDMAQVAIITNGNPRQQANKIAHLRRLSSLIAPERIIYANEHAPKPAIDSASALRKVMELRNALYLGDTETDCTFANAAGFDFFRVDFRLK